MAAQEYYSGAPVGDTQHAAPYPASPPPGPQHQQSFQVPSPSVQGPPPPYEAFVNNQQSLQNPEQDFSRPHLSPHHALSSPHVSFADEEKRPHSQPPPQMTSSGQREQNLYRPPNLAQQTPPGTYPGPQMQQHPLPPQNLFPPQQPQQPPFNGQQHYQSPPQQALTPPQYFAPPPPPGRPSSHSNPGPPPQFLHPNAGTHTPQYPPSPGPYAGQPQYQQSNHYSKSHSPRRHSRSSSRSRSRDRRHHRNHSQHHHHHGNEAQGNGKEVRSRGKRDKGTVDSFLGAGVGGIIGDAIFPGLGTVGGALLGGYGGHRYGEGKDTKRDREAARRYSESRGRRRDGEY